MNVRCPNCHNTVELAANSDWNDLPCPTCGSSFSVLNDETVTYKSSETRTIGHFEIQEQIGVGEFGSVWKARDLELDRTVAIKIPRGDRLA